MFDVFISYSSRNKPQADRFCSALEKETIACWMAPRDIPAGSHWAASIVQALRNAKVMLLLLSAEANDSEQVAREVDLAAASRLPIVPVLLENIQLSDMLQYYLSVCHRLENSMGDEALLIAQTVKTIQTLLKPAPGAKIEQSLAAPSLSGEQLIDIYDRDMNQIGTAKRSGVHREGLWHKTCHCWFISRDGDETYLLVQKRSLEKADFPGLLDITAGKHMSAGETDRAGMGRITTELGVSVDFEQTTFVGIRTYEEHLGDFYNREFNSVYLCPTVLTLRDFDLQPEEVSGVCRFKLEDAAALFCGARASAPAVCLLAGHRELVQMHTTLQNFVPRSDDYYYKVCLAAKDYFAGQAIRQI